MTTEEKKQEKERFVLTQKIQENEQLLDDLRLEQRRAMEQLEESQLLINRQGEQTAPLYQELIQAGDVQANDSLIHVQELTRQVKAAFRSQQEAVETAYKKANQKIEKANATLYKKRGELEW